MPENTRSRLAGLAAFAGLPVGAVDVLMFILSLDQCLKKANKKASHPTVGTRSCEAFVVPPEFEPASAQNGGHGSLASTGKRL
jgi:hypothetical protein